MTGSTITSADLDPRRRRMLFRAWHRGIREMDLILGQFADSEIAKLGETDLDEFESILGEDDNDLFKWVCGKTEAPARLQTPLFRRILAFRPEEAFPSIATSH
ncbi:MAG: succinate dehydrogenase assembly factor 2 [Rhizobium sp.]|nr:succinate dehydrogenase assembly factor 2 [Rhizobium sp.]